MRGRHKWVHRKCLLLARQARRPLERKECPSWIAFGRIALPAAHTSDWSQARVLASTACDKGRDHHENVQPKPDASGRSRWSRLQARCRGTACRGTRRGRRCTVCETRTQAGCHEAKRAHPCASNRFRTNKPWSIPMIHCSLHHTCINAPLIFTREIKQLPTFKQMQCEDEISAHPPNRHHKKNVCHSARVR